MNTFEVFDVGSVLRDVHHVRFDIVDCPSSVFHFVVLKEFLNVDDLVLRSGSVLLDGVDPNIDKFVSLVGWIFSELDFLLVFLFPFELSAV